MENIKIKNERGLSVSERLGISSNREKQIALICKGIINPIMKASFERVTAKLLSSEEETEITEEEIIDGTKAKTDVTFKVVDTFSDANECIYVLLNLDKMFAIAAKHLANIQIAKVFSNAFRQQ